MVSSLYCSARTAWIPIRSISPTRMSAVPLLKKTERPSWRQRPSERRPITIPGPCTLIRQPGQVTGRTIRRLIISRDFRRNRPTLNWRWTGDGNRRTVIPTTAANTITRSSCRSMSSNGTIGMVSMLTFPSWVPRQTKARPSWSLPAICWTGRTRRWPSTSTQPSARHGTSPWTSLSGRSTMWEP